MDYFQIQGDVVTISIRVFILSLIIPLIIGILLQRYVPRVCDILERKISELVSYIAKKGKNGIVLLSLYHAYRKIDKHPPDCSKKAFESILAKINTEIGKKFVSKHDLERKIVNCLGLNRSDADLFVLKILRFLTNMKGPELQIKRQEISKIINLLSDKNEEVQEASMETLKLLGEQGIRKELMFAMFEERSPEIEYQLANLCRYFLEVYSPREFIDDETIQPIFRFLRYDNGTLRFNLLGGLLRCADQKILKMSHITHYDTENVIQAILSGNIVDQRTRVLSILYMFTRNQEQKEIVDSGLLPLLIRNLLESNNAVRCEADKVLHELLECAETKQITNMALDESNAKGCLTTKFTI